MTNSLPKLIASGHIEARFKVTTPMYLGDADQLPSTISPNSFKGALRFWWRAIVWPMLQAQSDSEPTALKQLHASEAILFGSAATKYSRRAAVRLTIVQPSQLRTSGTPVGDGIKYLLCLGLGERRCITPCEFVANFYFNPQSLGTGNLVDFQTTLLDALRYLGTFGGLGSRARHGFGSVALQKLLLNGVDQTVADSPLGVKELLSQFAFTAPKPPFTAFSKLSRIDQSATHRNALQLLNEIGENMQKYRSWRGDKLFEDDHHLAADIINGERPSLPRRGVFGLPHNYFFSSNRKSLGITVADDNRSRRASPLFIHIHQFPGDDDFVAMQTLLPAVFLPATATMQFKPAYAGNIPHQESKIEWKVIHDYLDRFESRNNLLDGCKS